MVGEMGEDNIKNQPIPEEIAEVIGGDPAKIRDGMAAFNDMDGEQKNRSSASKNIGVSCGGCNDNWLPLRDYSGEWWHFEQGDAEAGREE